VAPASLIMKIDPDQTASRGYDELPLVAEVYDHVELYRNRRDVPFWVEAARASGGPVLELGAGTGRTLIPIAAAGIDVVGLDRSTHMLEVCRQHLAQQPEDVRGHAQLLLGDMRTFDLARVFPLVTAPFRVFQFLPETDDQMDCLASIRRHLETRGRLILDLAAPALELFVDAIVAPELTLEPELVLADGRRVQRRHKYLTRDRHHLRLTFDVVHDVTHPDGRQERLIQPFTIRYLSRFEVEHLLARCGFALEEVFGDYDRSPYGSASSRELIVVARKA
jgi:SAM-dependent methyltransferase